MCVIDVRRGHVLRAATELFIAQTFATHYGASGVALPPLLRVMLDSSGRHVCACGLRFADDGYLSEAYLDRPVEAVLTEWAKQPVSRSSIFEVTSLAGRTPRASRPFLLQQIAFGEQAGFEWALFTATQRLRSLLGCLGLDVVHIANAAPDRLATGADWGTYYDNAPIVCAVNRQAVAHFFMSRQRSAIHA